MIVSRMRLDQDRLGGSECLKQNERGGRTTEPIGRKRRNLTLMQIHLWEAIVFRPGTWLFNLPYSLTNPSSADLHRGMLLEDVLRRSVAERRKRRSWQGPSGHRLSKRKIGLRWRCSKRWPKSASGDTFIISIRAVLVSQSSRIWIGETLN